MSGNVYDEKVSPGGESRSLSHKKQFKVIQLSVLLIVSSKEVI
jgi:hypothetical protein